MHPEAEGELNTSRTMTSRRAATVSSRGRLSAEGPAGTPVSGNNLLTGSSSGRSPSSASAIVTAAVMGLVVDAIRNSESRCTGRPSIDTEPSISTWTSSSEATSATSPGTRSGPTCDAAASPNTFSASSDNPLISSLPLSPGSQTKDQRRTV
jgi:hypothetical protein